MKNVVNNKVEKTTVEFPKELMDTCMKLAKSYMNIQRKFALFRADCILDGFDDRELVKAAFVAAGYEQRDSRGAITNSDKFLAAALMVRNNDMSEKDFFALKTAEAAAAFKAAGGADGGGRDPEAWKNARIDLAKQAAGEKAGEARPPSGEEKNKPQLTAYEIGIAFVSLRKDEMSLVERKDLSDRLLS
jgi:hypothetical protein